MSGGAPGAGDYGRLAWSILVCPVAAVDYSVEGLRLVEGVGVLDDLSVHDIQSSLPCRRKQLLHSAYAGLHQLGLDADGHHPLPVPGEKAIGMAEVILHVHHY